MVRATRAKTLPLIVAPVAVGTALAEGTRSLVWSVIALVGACALHLGSMAFNDVADARTGADRVAGMDRGGVVTASGLIDAGVAPRALAMTGAVMFALAAACFGALAMVWVPALWLGAAGALLGAGYSGRPLRYGYVGRGLGQIGVVLAYGFLPVAGAVGARAPIVWSDTVWVGLVCGILTAVAFTVADLLHHRADKAVGKHTIAAVLGPEGALLTALAMAVVAFALIPVLVALERLPAVALVALLAGVPFAAAWNRAFADPNPQRSLNLLGASLGATVLAQLVLALALAV